LGKLFSYEVALLAVPELEPYVVKGLDGYFADGEVVAEIAERGRYALVKSVVTAVVVEEVIRPRFLYDALLDLDMLNDVSLF